MAIAGWNGGKNRYPKAAGAAAVRERSSSFFFGKNQK